MERLNMLAKRTAAALLLAGRLLPMLSVAMLEDARALLAAGKPARSMHWANC